MQKGKTSVRNGIQDLLCPFTYVRINQGANGSYSHKGTMACDIGYKLDKLSPYYAPCDVKCVWIYPSFGQAMWQSLNPVRFADGTINYITFVTAHDNSFNATVGQVVKQGVKLGNMGNKQATGYHCHIQCAKGRYTVSNWKKNEYGIYHFPNEVDFDSVFFMDDTEIEENINTRNAKWVYIKDSEITPVPSMKKLYLPATVDTWRVYPLDKTPTVGNEVGFLKPSKFGGLTYDILNNPQENVVTIQTRDYGKVNIFVSPSTGAVIK